MKKVYKIIGCFTVVHEDNYEHGEGAFCNNWSIRETCPTLELTEFNSLSELLENVNEKYLPYKYERDNKNFKNWAIFEDPGLKNEIRFDTDDLLDEDNDCADNGYIKLWKKGKKKLYNAHTVLYVKAIYVEETEYDEMYQDAKALGLEDI